MGTERIHPPRGRKAGRPGLRSRQTAFAARQHRPGRRFCARHAELDLEKLGVPLTFPGRRGPARSGNAFRGDPLEERILDFSGPGFLVRPGERQHVVIADEGAAVVGEHLAAVVCLLEPESLQQRRYLFVKNGAWQIPA